jgi:hypothetical protein
MGVKENLQSVRERITRAATSVNRDPESIKLVAVTKTVELPLIKKAIQLGVKAIGETRVQEAEEKYGKLGKVVEWHMIGHLQSNKAKRAVKLFDMIQSIDSEKIAKKVSNHALAVGKRMPVLVQVNTSREKTKFGVKPEEAIDFVQRIKGLEGIEVQGLMTIAPLVSNPEDARPCFRELKELNRKLGLEYLSMGMTNDFEVAIQEGANMVRIGTAIFSI